MDTDISIRPQKALVGSALVAVYFIWGSTYLALRFGLEGFPPFILNGARFLVAGGVMYTILRLRGVAPPSPRQWWNATRMGSLLLVGGVGLMTIAEDLGVGSGIAATAAAVIPVWSALIGGFFGQWPVRREVIGLAVGLAGVLVLAQEGDLRSSVTGLVLVVVAPLLWSFGSVWGARLDMPPGFMTPASQLLSAGVVMLIAGTLAGERVTEAPTGGAWSALLYLTVMGSIVAYTAYVFLLRSVRPAMATSYAYVNPVVAVVLGVTMGAEIISGPILVALPLILIGVGLVASAPPRSSAEHSPVMSGAPAEEAA